MPTMPLYQVRSISNLKDMLNQSCEIFKQKIAFKVKKKNSDDIHPVSYAQFTEDVNSLGTALIKQGLEDKRIAIISENRYEWAVSYLAVVNGIGVVVPIDKALPDSEITSIIERSEVRAVIYSNKFEALMRQINNKSIGIDHFIGMDLIQEEQNFLPFHHLINLGKNLLESGDRSFADASVDDEKMGMMLFTSGTTEASKAVMLSHKNVCSNIMQVSSVFKVHQDDVFLSFLPLHHMYECTCGFLAAIYNGAAIAYCEGLKHIVKNLKEYGTTVMCSVPLVYENMYKKIWSKASKTPGMATKMKLALRISNFLRKLFRINLTKKIFKQIHETLGGRIRVFLSGAAAIDPKVAKGFRDFGIHFLQGYGLTECSPLVTANGDVHFKDDAAGLPLPGVEVRIDNPSENGIGEIITRGPNVMLGYYENQEATAKVLKDGWFYTGDLGYMDKKGFVYITGRKKNVIVLKNGKNVFPEELETMLNRSRYIKESMVYGKTDEDGDVKICAVLIVNNETFEENFPDKVLGDEEVKAAIEREVRLVNKKMPSYKYIREYTVRQDELIKTTTQKVKRYLEKVV